MASQIFISHSRRDRELLVGLDKIFGKAGLRQYRASFENQSPPVSENLKQEINRSKGIFVVLGPEAGSLSHTMSWIGWEAGIAAQRDMPVWILEDWQSQVELPIPSFTDYLLWDSGDDDQYQRLRDIIESMFGKPLVADDGPKTYRETSKLEDSERNQTNLSSAPELSTDPDIVRCPYNECGEEFHLWFDDPTEFNCPACRFPIRLEDSTYYE